jgi:hypothetical protein
MPSLKRLLTALALAALVPAILASSALASTNQVTLMQDDLQVASNTTATLQTMRSLGVTLVKVGVDWNAIAPDPKSTHAPSHFSASNPASYPAANWAVLDNVVRTAAADGLQVGLDVTGPGPLWAAGSGMPKPAKTNNCPCGWWKPSGADFKSFMQALGTRYGGSYTPAGATTALPAVRWWSIWNEPNYGPDLAPQAIDNNTVDEAAIVYRGLVDGAWSGLAASGHTTSSDTILIGETAPRGIQGKGFPGSFSGTVPVLFLQSLYCVNAQNRMFTGATAKANDCPGNASSFRSQNPALFSASGYALHPYAQGVAPNVPTYACGLQFCLNPKTKKSDPYYLDFPEIGRAEKLLDKLNSVYHSGTHFPIWNTEYGFWTNPPDNALGPKYSRYAVPPATAAYYMNWAEYLSYKQARIASYDQYLLVDTPGNTFADGLELSSGKRLATWNAFAMPLYLPTTTASHAANLEVWGGLRASAFVLSGYGLAPQAQLQFAPGSSTNFTTVQSVTVSNTRGYFDVHHTFTQSGSVRVAWSLPGGTTEYSRTQAISIK